MTIQREVISRDVLAPLTYSYEKLISSATFLPTPKISLSSRVRHAGGAFSRGNQPAVPDNTLDGIQIKKIAIAGKSSNLRQAVEARETATGRQGCHGG